VHGGGCARTESARTTAGGALTTEGESTCSGLDAGGALQRISFSSANEDAVGMMLRKRSLTP
jgi:hypothetical protein